MIIKLKKNTSPEEIREITQHINCINVKFEILNIEGYTAIEVKPDLTIKQSKKLQKFSAISEISANIVTFKYKSKENKKINLGKDICFGEGFFNVIAGPCSIESYDQLKEIAISVKKSGARLLRGGAFKPRSSPYSFQGLGKEALDIVINVKKEIGIPIVVELTSTSSIDKFDQVDVIQIGARNMQNFDLLKEAAKLKKTILLKRGFGNTIEEFLLSAEYIMSYGNENIILCERGVRTFDTCTRNMLDISCIPIIKSMSNLPIIIDPSHALGRSDIIKPICLAGVSVGADGLIIEVHNTPELSFSDKNQAISCNEFHEYMKDISDLTKFHKKI